MVRVSITVDVEKDMPPFFRSFIGIEKGLPKILSILNEFGVKATFFVTAEICEKFPELVRDLAKKHEIACHGFRHEELHRLKLPILHELIEKATDFLKGATGKKPIGFRAPRLRVSKSLLYVLKDLGYLYDSSTYLWFPWQIGYSRLARKIDMREFPASIDNSMLRVPGGMRLASTQFERDPLVVFMHPWDAIDVRHEGLEKSEVKNRILVWWCSIGTGEKFLMNLLELILALQKRGAKFEPMRDLLG